MDALVGALRGAPEVTSVVSLAEFGIMMEQATVTGEVAQGEVAMDAKWLASLTSALTAVVNDTASQEDVWQALRGYGVEGTCRAVVVHLVAALYGDGGKDMNVALWAARAYLLACTLPGAAAHGVLRAPAVAKALSVVAACVASLSASGSANASARASTTPVPGDEERKGVDAEDEDVRMEGGHSDDGEESISAGAPGFAATLASLELVVEAAKSFAGLLRAETMARFGATASELVRTVVTTLLLPFQGMDSIDGPRARVQRGVTALMDTLHECVVELLQARHGGVVVTARRVLQLTLKPLCRVAPPKRAGGAAVKLACQRAQALLSHIAHVVQLDSTTADVRVGLQDALRALAQHVCVTVGDKANAHAQASAAVLAVLHALPPSTRAVLVKFLHTFSRHKKANYRAFACTAASDILQQPHLWKDIPFGAALAPTTPLAATTAQRAENTAQAEGADAAAAAAPAAGSAAGSAAASPNPFASPSPSVTGSASSLLPAARDANDRRPAVLQLLDILLRRCSDKVPTVRARALACLSTILAPVQRRDPLASLLPSLLLQLCHEHVTLASAGGDGDANATMFVVQRTSTSSTSTSTPRRVSLTSLSATTPATLQLSALSLSTPTPRASHASLSRRGAMGPAVSPSSGAVSQSALMALLLRRLGDSKPAVRKHALAALTALALNVAAYRDLTTLDMTAACFAQAVPGSTPVLARSSSADVKAPHVRPSSALGDTGLRLIAARCGDVSVSVRKAAIVAVSALLAAEPWDRSLQTLWLAGVIPLCHDPESSVQSKALEQVHQFVIEPLLKWHSQAKATRRAATRQAAARAATAATATAAGADEDTEEVGGPSSIQDLTAVRLNESEALWSLLRACSTHPDLVKSLALAIRTIHKSTSVPAARVFAALVHAAHLSSPATSDADSGVSLSTPRRATMRVAVWILFEALAPRLRACRRLNVAELVQCWLTMAPKRGDRAGGDRPSVSVPAAQAAATAGTGTPTKDTADTWNQHASRVLNTLAELAPHLADAEAERLQTHLRAGLNAFRWAPSVTASAVNALLAVTCAQAESVRTASQAAKAWGQELLASCQPGLEAYVRHCSGKAVSMATSKKPSELDVALRLFVVGEVAMLGIDGKAGGGARAAASTSAAAANSNLTLAELQAANKKLVVHVPVPRALTTAVQTLVSSQLSFPDQATGSDESKAVEQHDGSAASSTDVPDQVRAHAVLALGKLCLLDYGLAKQYVSVLVQELRRGDNTSVAVRNNILFVLSDLCVRYTQLVDRYVPVMATAIHDSSAVVRRHTLMLLTHLLVEDYVKWRTVLVFHFLTALADDNGDVRAFAESAMTSVLLKKFPTLFASNFVDVVVVLAGCRAHPNYTAALHALDGYGYTDVTLPTTLVGPRFLRKRMHIYRTMLRHMTDEQRFTASARIIQDVLGGVVDGVLRLPATAAATQPPSSPAAFATPRRVHSDGSEAASVTDLLQEAFAVLASREIRLPARARRGKGGAGAPDGVEAATGLDVSPTQAALAAAKRKVMSQLYRKNTVENVVPILIALKGMLQKARSPLLASLMRFIKILFSDYREDVADMLAADPQLAQEVKYDLRKFDEQEQQAALLRAAAATASATPSTSTPTTRGIRRHRRSGVGPLRSPQTLGGRTPVRNNPFSPRAPVTPGRPSAGARAAAKAATSPGTQSLVGHTPKLRRSRSQPAGVGFALGNPPSTPKNEAAGAGSGAGAGAGSTPIASPLPSHLPIRVFPDLTPSQQPKPTKRSVDVFMPSPEADMPRPRKWRVRSTAAAPTDQASAAKTAAEEAAAEDDTPVVFAPSVTALNAADAGANNPRPAKRVRAADGDENATLA